MKRTLILTLILILGSMVFAQTADLQKARLQFLHQRDASQKYLYSTHPMIGSVATPKSADKRLPNDRVWFPGEWEEVQAVTVTCYYEYVVPGYEHSFNWMADPVVSGWADYYKYTASGWSKQGEGPYTAILDSASTFGKVFFYLIDGIQSGGAEAWVRVEQPSDSNIVKRTLQRMNLRSNNVKFIVGTGNSFWYRDCGPICFYYGDQDSVAMLDFEYYPGRALDDSLPSLIHHQMGIPNYVTTLEWEGGNCLVDGAGMVISSDAIYTNNADRRGQITWDGNDPNTIGYTTKVQLTAGQVKTGLSRLMGQRATYILPAFQYDGGTGHIDLYADMCDENGFVFSKFPDEYSSWRDYATASKNIDSLCSYMCVFDRPYKKTYIPFPCTDNGSSFTSQTSYNNNYTRTYSNHTFVNNVILQPVFSNVVDGEPSAEWDRLRFDSIKAAYPGYTLYPINVKEFDGSGGAIHCITKQIPADNPVRILHKNITGRQNGMLGSDIPVSAIITNRSGIAHSECHYRINGGEWNEFALEAHGNKHSGAMPTASIGGLSEDSVVTVEYYLSATSNNGKTITKPITAGNGGYFTFFYDTVTVAMDSTEYDFDTTSVDMNDITFDMAENWYTEEPEAQPHESITSVEQETAFGQFYPNPSNAQAHINIDIPQNADYTVQIIDLTGRTIHTSTLQVSGSIVYTINAQRLAKGIYNVVFSSKTGKIVRKLVVE